MFTLPQYTWDKDRELCKKCKHLREEPRKHSQYTSTAMACVKNPYKASKGIGSCIDNRTRGPCGKEGKLFEAGENSPVTLSPVLKANRPAVNPLRQPHEVISIG